MLTNTVNKHFMQVLSVIALTVEYKCGCTAQQPVCEFKLSLTFLCDILKKKIQGSKKAILILAKNPMLTRTKCSAKLNM